MGEKDIIEKQLEDYNEVFADIVNGLLFDGETVVEESQLDDMQVFSQYKADDGKLHEEERDKLKRWHDGLINIATIGLENQSDIFKYMPLRVIGYDGAAYRAQLLKSNAKHDKVHSKGKQKIPFTPVPVITIVLYYGSKKWKHYKRLKDVVAVPDRLKPYFSDYKINVFEIAWLTEEQISRFTSDFRVVANLFRKKRIDPNYIPDDLTEIKHVDEVLKLIAAISGDDRYLNVIGNGKGKVRNMCEVAERLEKRGIEKGIQQGLQQGLKKGLKQGIDEKGIQVFLNCIARGMSREDAQAIADISDSLVEKALRTINGDKH